MSQGMAAKDADERRARQQDCCRDVQLAHRQCNLDPRTRTQPSIPRFCVQHQLRRRNEHPQECRAVACRLRRLKNAARATAAQLSALKNAEPVRIATARPDDADAVKARYFKLLESLLDRYEADEIDEAELRQLMRAAQANANQQSGT